MAKHLSSGCTAHELHLETPVEAAETPEAHRSEDMGGGKWQKCFKFSDKLYVEKHDSVNNTLLQPPTFPHPFT